MGEVGELGKIENKSFSCILYQFRGCNGSQGKTCQERVAVGQC